MIMEMTSILPMYPLYYLNVGAVISSYTNYLHAPAQYQSMIYCEWPLGNWIHTAYDPCTIERAFQACLPRL